MEKLKSDIVFVCRKCDHHLFVNKKKLTIKFLLKLIKRSCDNCGYKGDYFCGHWCITREGNYKKEYGKKKFYKGRNS